MIISPSFNVSKFLMKGVINMSGVWTFTIISVVFYLAVNIAVKIAQKRREKKARNGTDSGNDSGDNAGNDTQY